MMRATPSNMRSSQRALNADLTPRCRSFRSEFMEAIEFASLEKSRRSSPHASLPMLAPYPPDRRRTHCARSNCRHFQCASSNCGLAFSPSLAAPGRTGLPPISLCVVELSHVGQRRSSNFASTVTAKLPVRQGQIFDFELTVNHLIASALVRSIPHWPGDGRPQSPLGNCRDVQAKSVRLAGGRAQLRARLQRVGACGGQPRRLPD